MAVNNSFRTLTATSIEGLGAGVNYVPYGFENGTVSGYTLGTTGTLTNGIPTGTPTFGSGASGNLTLSATSSSPISENYSLSYASSAATTAGNMVASPSCAINSADRAKVLTFKFYYSVPTNPSNGNFSGTSSNSFGVAAYDETNSSWLPVAGNFSMTQNSGVGIATGTFQTNVTTASMRFVIYNANATSGAITMYFDQIYVGPQTAPIGAVATDWSNSLAFTFSNFGTVTNNNLVWRRVGDSMEVIGSVNAGTTVASVFSLNLPSGYAIDLTKLAAGNQRIGYVDRATSASNSFATNATGPYPLFTDGSTTNAIFYATTASSSDYVKGNGNSFNSGEKALISFIVPIKGWSSNVQMSNDTDTRVVSFVGYKSANQSITANTTDITYTTQKDSHGAWNGSQYIVPISGDYFISNNGSASSSTTIGAYVNGSLYKTIYDMSGAANYSGSGLLPNLKAGDILSFRGTISVTVNGNASSASVYNLFINRLSGPSVIAATESVNCSYYASANGTISTTSSLNYDTKIYDSHNAVTTGAGVWKFTAPISGVYNIGGQVLITATSENIFIYKNGTIFMNLGATYATGTGALNPNTDVKLNAGDYIDIRSGNSKTYGGGSLTTAGTTSIINIKRVGN